MEELSWKKYERERERENEQRERDKGKNEGGLFCFLFFCWMERKAGSLTKTSRNTRCWKVDESVESATLENRSFIAK